MNLLNVHAYTYEYLWICANMFYVHVLCCGIHAWILQAGRKYNPFICCLLLVCSMYLFLHSLTLSALFVIQFSLTITQIS